MRLHPILVLAGCAAVLCAPAPVLSQDRRAPDVFDVPEARWEEFEKDNELWKLTPEQEQVLADRAADVLRGSRSEAELKRALWVLARVGIDRTRYVQDVVRVLQGPARMVREDALRTIGTLQGQEAEALLKQFKPSPRTDPPTLQTCLLRAASEAGVGSAWLRPVIESARDPAEVSSLALDEIITLVGVSNVRNEETRAFLETCVRRADLQSAGRATRSLGEYGAAAVPALRSALENPLPGLQAAAAESLGQIGPAGAQAVPRLLQIIRTAPLYDSAAPTKGRENQKFVAPVAAAKALRWIGVLDAGLCTVLIEQIRRGRMEMQSACVWTAGWLGCGDDAALGAMRAMTVQGGLNPAHEQVGSKREPGSEELERRWISRRATWMVLLRREGPEAMRRDMIGYFGQDPEQVFLQAFGDIDSGEGAEVLVPVLVSLLRTQDGRLADEAAQALSRMGAAARAAIPGLLGAAVELGPRRRARGVIESMNRVGPVGPEGIPALRRLRWGPDLEASQEARRALRLAGAE